MTKTNAATSAHCGYAKYRLSHFMLVSFLTIIATASIAHAEHEKPRKNINPALLTEISKDPIRADDFLRFGFLDVGVVPTMLARSNALRTFMTYTAFFEPALPVSEAVRFVGLEPVESQTLAVYRCKHPNLEALEPVLAKWPEVFNAILLDLGTQYSCPATTNTPENEILCIVESFHDTPMPTASEALANLYDIAAMLTGNPVLQGTLRTLYGIDLGFSGLGLAVQGSGDPAFVYTAEHVLDEAIVPEYLVKNAFIAEAGCHCILVPPYPGRSRALIDPELVWEVGTPECTMVPRLPRAEECSDAPPLARWEKKVRPRPRDVKGRQFGPTTREGHPRGQAFGAQREEKDSRRRAVGPRG